jgi:hypothetical protein
MRFLGHVEVVSFLREHPGYAENLLAWLGEIQHRYWRNSRALAADFQSVDVTCPPAVVFRLGRPELVIETLADFRNGIMLLTRVQAASEFGVHP